ncbi:MAG TPA: phytanoyl-CoA dioxygenase family protein [Candidatus Dormibacteraeota bacterium]|nr:phytanoyl-CoA dioxygenase family protein [Candidatus Dormibacteraeota bacterium]
MHNLAVPNERVSRIDLARMVEETGFVVVPRCLDEEMVQRLCACLSAATYATRNLLTVPIVRELATSPSVRALAETVLGKKCFAVKATFFNKTQEANWKVVWHQDLTIAVRERLDVDGFGPWTTKGGVWHVQPSAEVMSGILAIRLHLDESGLDNGPLRVIPGSHRNGRLSAEQVRQRKEEPAVTCTVPKGGALLMRPLLLHASSECAVVKSRRVIHLEFAAAELPLGLHWHDKV